MTASERLLLALSIVLVDLALFALPLTGIAAAYLVLRRPPWFRVWIERLYESG